MIIENVAREFGGTVTWDHRQRHILYEVRLPGGIVAPGCVASGLRNDEYKLTTWTRQHIRRGIKAHHEAKKVSLT